jgi:F-type H+-transporting ATPase subunit b
MLDINLTAVISQIVAFVILVAVLGKFFFTPVGNIIATRQKEIQDTLDQVAEDRRAMERTRGEYEQRLAGIEAEAREHISSAVHQAQQEAAAILAKGREEAAQQHARALAEIEQERRKSVAQIRAEMADLAVLAAGRVLEKEINPAVHRQLISDFIDEVGAGGARA